MEIAGFIIALIAAIPAGYFLYDRYFRLKHKVVVGKGNVCFSRILSKIEQRNEKLALVVIDLSVVNSGNTPVTLKEIVLKYNDGNNIKETRPYTFPTGEIDGKEVIVFATSKDKIIVAWENIWEKIIKHNVLEPGAIVRGGAVFVLDHTVDHANEIKDLCIVVRDYLGNETEHSGQPVQDWHGIMEKGFSLVAAPAKKVGENIVWEGLAITTENPA